MLSTRGCSHATTSLFLVVLFSCFWLSPARAGRIVVANDDWIWWTPYGFSAPSDGAQFAQNVARWFVGNRSGSFLAYGGWPGDPWPDPTHPGLVAPELKAAMESAGHQWTVDNTVTLDLKTLLNYDAIFIGVLCDPSYPADPSYIQYVNDLLTQYVNLGGNVYVFSGGGNEDPTSWDFLETFGLDFDASSNNSLYGHISLSSTHSVFTGVDSLYHVNGRCIVDLAPLDPRNQIIATDTDGRGLFAVYDPYCGDNEGPIVAALDIEPVAVNTLAAISAVVDDSATGGSNIQCAEYSIDGSGWYTMFPRDGAYDDVIEDVDATISVFSTTGVHEVYIRGRDSGGNYGEPGYTLLAVYDPDGGFITGGGWIDSPPGAYMPDPTLTGKANFGFVSKYRKGATEPTGQTEFVFQAGGLTFHSTSYDWLVVTGSNYARFKGTGTINGAGEYKFQLWAGDGDPDTFRIKIWTEDDGTENVVYDNGFDQAIGGGSIVIHTK